MDLNQGLGGGCWIQNCMSQIEQHCQMNDFGAIQFILLNDNLLTLRQLQSAPGGSLRPTGH
jgi:hypothetical protein